MGTLHTTNLDGKKFKFSTTPHDKKKGWVDADWFRVTKSAL
ncbi:MAG: hypothetical protein Q4D56_00905 [Bacteroides sp.]|nr:hypothetical protein [Bacteroides sp.]